MYVMRADNHHASSILMILTHHHNTSTLQVGCVPKKLMHYAGLIGAAMHHDAPKYGWVIPDGLKHDWATLRETVQMYIKRLNFGYRSGLTSSDVCDAVWWLVVGGWWLVVGRLLQH
jgi:pyruvate/2-oxoglutarate dehydrogenase complex dihydrolipoamide dehydrogenase (E3) component